MEARHDLIFQLKQLLKTKDFERRSASYILDSLSSYGAVDYLEHWVTVEEYKHIFKNLDANDLQPFVDFLANRWDRIQHSDLVYVNPNLEKHPVTQLCIQLAMLISPILNISVNALLMPTVRPEIPADRNRTEFVLSDDNVPIDALPCAEHAKFEKYSNFDFGAASDITLFHTVPQLTDKALNAAEKFRVEKNLYKSRLVNQLTLANNPYRFGRQQHKEKVYYPRGISVLSFGLMGYDYQALSDLYHSHKYSPVRARFRQHIIFLDAHDKIQAAGLLRHIKSLGFLFWDYASLDRFFNSLKNDESISVLLELIGDEWLIEKFKPSPQTLNYLLNWLRNLNFITRWEWLSGSLGDVCLNFFIFDTNSLLTVLDSRLLKSEIKTRLLVKLIQTTPPANLKQIISTRQVELKALALLEQDETHKTFLLKVMSPASNNYFNLFSPVVNASFSEEKRHGSHGASIAMKNF